MALIISTGFVVDDAIVVRENISRCLEQGCRALRLQSEGRTRLGSPCSRLACR